MNYDDDDMENGREIVRPFMATRGRVRARSEEYPLETLVSATPAGRLNAATLDFERKQIVNDYGTAISIVEISAHLELPLRAAQILVSEMIADGHLHAHETVTQVGVDVLLRIRDALTALN